jgi:lactose/L-arabinose transport system permease protein
MTKAKKGSLHQLININGWLFVSTALVLITIFMLYPIIDSLWLSLHSGKGSITKFVGFGNIIRLFDDEVFWFALKNTLVFLIIQVPAMIFLSLILSTCLNSPKLKMRGWIRMAIFLPCVTSLVAYSILFKSMFSFDGVVNSFLIWVGIIDSGIEWITDPFYSKVLIIFAITWRWTGYNMIFFLAAMQNIDKSIYEAAKIDGVSPIKQMFFLTIPLLKPVILFTAVMSTIGTLQLFDEVLNITGDTDATITLAVYIYNLSFKYMPNFGYATTVSYVIVILAAFISLLQFQLSKDKS